MPEMDEAVLKRVLPHSIEAEQSVIGSMLMDKEAITIQANSFMVRILWKTVRHSL